MKSNILMMCLASSLLLTSCGKQKITYDVFRQLVADARYCYYEHVTAKGVDYDGKEFYVKFRIDDEETEIEERYGNKEITDLVPTYYSLLHVAGVKHEIEFLPPDQLNKFVFYNKPIGFYGFLDDIEMTIFYDKNFCPSEVSLKSKVLFDSDNFVKCTNVGEGNPHYYN